MPKIKNRKAVHDEKAREPVREMLRPLSKLTRLSGLVPPAWLAGHYLWDAVVAALHWRAGDTAEAERHGEHALANPPSPRVRELLERRPWA